MFLKKQLKSLVFSLFDLTFANVKLQKGPEVARSGCFERAEMKHIGPPIRELQKDY